MQVFQNFCAIFRSNSIASKKGANDVIFLSRQYIDRFHKGRPINYSFVNVEIRPTSLVLMEHFFCIFSVLTRLVGLISTKTIQYFFWPPFMQSVYTILRLTVHRCQFYLRWGHEDVFLFVNQELRRLAFLRRNLARAPRAPAFDMQAIHTHVSNM